MLLSPLICTTFGKSQIAMETVILIDSKGIRNSKKKEKKSGIWGQKTSVSLGFHVIFKCVLDDACIFACVLLCARILYKYCHVTKCRLIVYLFISTTIKLPN